MSVGAQAQIDYNEGFEILPSNYLAPRMECEKTGDDVGQKCVLLVYDNTTKKLELFTTSSRFLNDSLPLTSNQTVLTDANYEHIIAINPSSSIPYDIYWISGYGFVIADGTDIPKRFIIDTGTLSNIVLMHTCGSSRQAVMTGDKDLENFWVCILEGSGQLDAYRLKYDGSDSHGGTMSYFQNWLGNGGGNYVGGVLLDGLDNESFILYSYNSTDGRKGYSNNTDAEIGAGRYDGVFEREYSVSSYEYFIRNSTYVARWDRSSNQTTAFFKFNGNDIISQSLWVKSIDVNDMVIIFQNSTGINIYNTWSSLYTAVPDEYNESKVVVTVQEDFFGLYVNAPYFPKVACSPSMGSCAMLYYDAGWLSTGGAGLKFYYTLTPDQDDWTYVWNFGSYTITGNESPYDIVYNIADGKFRIIDGIRNKIFEWSGVGNPSLVKTYTGVSWIYDMFPLMFVDDQGEYLFMGVDYLEGGITDYNKVSIYQWNTDTETVVLGLAVDRKYTIYGWGTGNSDASDYWYDTWRGTTGYTNFDIKDELTYSGTIQYYYPEEGVAFFEQAAAGSVGQGIYYAGHTTPHGTDWVFPSVTPYYTYDAIHGEETETDSMYFEESKIYGVARRANDMGCIPFFGCGKVYFYEKANNPVFVTTSYYDEAIETTNPLITSMTVECLDPAINYTAAAGASFNVFQLPCNSNINLTLQTTAAYPFYSETNFDFLIGCNQMNIEAVYIKSFTSTLTVRDQVTGNAVPSATVYIEGTPYTTDANGQIDYVVAPTTANFTVTTIPLPTCLVTMDATGVAVSENRYIYATKAGYYPWSGTVAFDFDGETIYLNQGEFIVSRVYYKDGIEATGEKTSALINATGADQIYVIRGGIPYDETEDNDFPVTFQTIDALSSYTVTLGLTWGNFTDTTQVSVTPAKNNYGCNENACFELPFYSTDPEVGCATDLDCEQSFCLGSIFKELIQCNTITGQCEYQQTACPTFCDNDIGCYTSVEANESCNFDSECYDLIACISTAVLRDAHCSPSLGVCVTEHVQCTYGCEYGACKLPPVVPTCDQSTVAGMLACTQAGIMGFIGSTYDPMFMLLAVIAIVVIFVTLLSLAVKGVSNVIR